MDQVAEYVVSLQTKPADGTPGAKIFADNCAMCHGAKGVGGAFPGAPRLDTKTRTFTQPTVAGVMRQEDEPHMGSMPSWSRRLDPVTIKMLALYVHSLGGGQ
jgi:cytochrome c oxidase cbb3-type subunit 3